MSDNVQFNELKVQALVTMVTALVEADLGKVVKASANKTVALCADGDKFMGVLQTLNATLAGVQEDGYIELVYTGSAPTLGWCLLAANATGGVKVGTTGDILYHVVNVDTGTTKVTFRLDH